MRPRRSLLLLVAPLVALSACGESSSAPAAVVDGTEISQEEVVDELEAIRANPDYVAAIESSGAAVLGTVEDAFDAAFVAQVLSRQIQFALVSNEVDRRGLSAGEDCFAAARTDLLSQLGGAGGPTAGEEVVAAFPPDYVERLLEWNADVLVLQADLVGEECLADDAIETFYEENRDEFVEFCPSHILVATAEEAQALAAQIAAGADFATLAAASSTDPGTAPNGGVLPCATAGRYVPEFEAAALALDEGEVSEPVQTQFGFHLIRIESRREVPLSEVRDQVASAISADAQQAFSAWYGEALAGAAVEVDPRYGRWDPDTGQVVRDPDGPAPADTVPDDATG